MKKLTALLICLVLLAALALPVMAAEVIQVTITSPVTTANPGDEIVFEISVSGSEACTSFGVVIQYDSTVFEMVKGECTLEDTRFGIFDNERGLACLFDKETVPAGVVGTFTMRVKADTVSGAAEISGVTSVKNGSDTVASELVPVSITIEGGSAPVEGIVPTEPAAQKPGEESTAAATEADREPEKEADKEPDETEETVPAVTEQETVPETAAAVTEEISAETAPTETEAAPEQTTQPKGLDGLMIPLVILVICIAALVVILILKRKNR